MNLQIKKGALLINNMGIINKLNKEIILFNKTINFISYDKHSCSNLILINFERDNYIWLNQKIDAPPHTKVCGLNWCSIFGCK